MLLHCSPGVCPTWILTNLFSFCLETQTNLYPQVDQGTGRAQVAEVDQGSKTLINHIGMICLGCRSFEGLA